MRRALLVIGVFLWPLSVASADTAHWKRVETGLTETAFVAVAADPALPEHLFVASRRSLYESSDAGKTWQPRFRARGQAQLASIAVSRPASLLLLSTDREVWLSRDGGRRWNKVNAPPAAGPLLAAVLDPHAPHRAYLVTQQRVFGGWLDGTGWEELFRRTTEPSEAPADDAQQVSGSLRALAIDPQQPTTLYLATSRALHHSLDGGRHWQRLIAHGLPPTPITRLTAVAHSPTALYASTGSGIARFVPAAQRWERLPHDAALPAINDVAATPTHLWAATAHGLYQFEITPEAIERLTASDAPPTRELLENFVHEPSIGLVREAAIRYAEVSPEKIRRWRRQAALRAMLPTVDVGVNRARSRDASIDEGTFPRFQIVETEDRDARADLSVKWELGNLIWSDDQTTIDVRSKLMVELRDDIVDQVTRAYFERRRLQVALLTQPPTDPHALLEKELRLQELTAVLDGLTGGYFSEQITIAPKTD